jgi:hypothetical protein
VAEILPINKLEAFMQNEGVYLTASPELRRLLHLFPAEINICQYEASLPKLKQSIRTFHDAVTLLMEDRRLFVEFLTLIAYGVIVVSRDEETKRKTGEDLGVFYLLAPTPQMLKQDRWWETEPAERPALLDENDKWWLTKPSAAPSMLDAGMTYLYYQQDMGYQVHDRKYVHKIEYPRPRQYLKQLQERMAVERYYDLEFGEPEMEDWLMTLAKLSGLERGTDAFRQAQEKALKSPNVQSFMLSVVEYDVLKGFEAGLMQELRLVQDKADSYVGQAHVNRGEEQHWLELLDLYCLAILVLREEAATKRETASRLAGQSSMIGGAVAGMTQSQ